VSLEKIEMQNRKEEHIDKIFRNGLEDFKMIPPPEVWDGVASSVSSGSRKRFYWIAGVAASLLFFLGMTWLFILQSHEPNTISEQNTAAPAVNNKPASDRKDQNKVEFPIVFQKGIEPVSGSQDRNKLPEIMEVQRVTSETSNGYIAEKKNRPDEEMVEPIRLLNATLLSSPVAAIKLNITQPQEPLSLNSFDILSSDANEMTNLGFAPVKTQKESKWGMGGSLSPLYSFRYSSSEDNHDMNYFYNNENPGYGFTGTISAIFKAKKRLTIQTGIQFSRSGISRSDVLFYSNPETGNLLKSGILRNNIPYPIESSLGTITSQNNPFYLTDFVLPDGELYTGNLSALPEFEKYEAFQSTMVQSFEFMEIPFLVRYKLIDRKFGVNVMSGVGTSFLVGNDVFIYHQDEKIILGQTEDVSILNFTGSVGLGFEYSFNPKLSLNIEPTFKYFLNSFNTNPEVSTHPYFFGIYSGLSFYF
jgi:hypothetical protein